jgi:hypothetical protein
MKFHIYCAIDCKNSANSRIEWAMGNQPLSVYLGFQILRSLLLAFSVLSILLLSLRALPVAPL